MFYVCSFLFGTEDIACPWVFLYDSLQYSTIEIMIPHVKKYRRRWPKRGPLRP